MGDPDHATPVGDEPTSDPYVPTPVSDEDPWADIEDDFLDESQDNEESEPTEQDEPESHLEQEESKTEEDALAKLPIPHKYKGKVQEWLDEQTSSLREESEGVNKKVQEQLEANKSLVNVFKEIAQNPSRIADYVLKYGEDLGIDGDLVSKYKNWQEGGQRQSETKSEAKKENPLKSLFSEYNEKLVGVTDANEFLRLGDEKYMKGLESFQENLMQGVLKTLEAYHGKLVEPHIGKFKEFTGKEEITRKANLWNQAKDTLSADESFKDFSKYEKQVIEKLTNDPKWSLIRSQINADPEKMAEQGITHDAVIKEVYSLVVHQDALKKAGAKKISGKGGMKPNSKQLTTVARGGSDWDDIKSDLFPEEMD